MSSNSEAFGALLRRLRKAKALTQAELGTLADIKEKTVSRLERGSQAPHPVNVRGLIKALELDDSTREVFTQAGIRAKQKRHGQQDEAAILPAAPGVDGRERERGEIVERFRRGQQFLVITGPGGVGKSYLASTVAQALRLHSWEEIPTFDCASLNSASNDRDRIDLAERIVETISRLEQERPDTQGEVSREGRPAILPQRYLMRLENVETIADTGTIAELNSLVARVPNLTLLLTSRRALRLKRQDTFPILPLNIGAARSLFMACAGARGVTIDGDHDSTIEKLCKRLDCLPLAIELAAGRIDQFTPREILDRLQRPLDLLIGGPRTAPTRQWTLRDTIAWSYDLLTPREQFVLRCFAISALDMNLAAIEALCGQTEPHAADVSNALMSLVDHSLVRSERNQPEARYSMLLTIREYALEKLTMGGEQAIVRDRYSGYYASLASELQGVDAEGSSYSCLALEHDNLHLALDLVSEQASADQAARFCLALSSYWLRRGSPSNADRLVLRVLALGTIRPEYHDQLIEVLFTLKIASGGLRAALVVAEGVLSEARSNVDRRREALAHVFLGVGCFMVGDYEDAENHLSGYFEMIAALLEPRHSIMAATTLALMAASQGNTQVTEQWLAVPPTRNPTVRAPYDKALLQATRGEVFLLRGATAEARASITQAMALSREARDDLGYARAEGVLGRIAFLEGDFVEAERLVTDALQRQELSGNWPALVTNLLVLGDVAQACRDRKSAEWYFGTAAELAQKIGALLGLASALEGLAASAIESFDGFVADFPRATRLLGSAINVRHDLGTPVPVSDRSRHEYLRDRLSPTVGEEGFESICERVGTFPEDDLSSGTSTGF